MSYTEMFNNKATIDWDLSVAIDILEQPADNSGGAQQPAPAIIEDVPVYTPEEERRPLTAPEKDDHTQKETVDPQQVKAQKRHEALSLNGVAEDAGLQDLNNSPNDADKPNSKKRQKERTALQRLIEEQVRIKSLVSWLETQAAFFYDKAKQERLMIGKNIEQMQKNSAFLGQAERYIEDYNNKKAIDPAKLVALLRQRGVDVDDDTPLPVLIKVYLPQEMAKANDDNQHLELDTESREIQAQDYEQRANDYSNKASILKQKVADIENRNLSPEDKAAALQEAFGEMPEEVIREYQHKYVAQDKTMESSEDIEADKKGHVNTAESFFDSEEENDTTVTNNPIVQSAIGGPSGMG